MRRLAFVVAVVLVLSAPATARADDPLACGQAPGNRFFWVERGFCDLELRGPERARGIVIWNHGLSSTMEQYRGRAATVFRIFHARGWDVIKINRNNLGEGVHGGLQRAVERTLEEVKAQRAAGYRRVILAGQSFGGLISLEAADASRDVYAVLAMAPGVRLAGATGVVDLAAIDRIVQRLKTERVGLVFPKDDQTMANRVRGESANAVLTARGAPYLLLDETSELTGHHGGTGLSLALLYGVCVADFFDAVELPPRRHVCPPTDEATGVRAMLPPWPKNAALIADPARLPDGAAALAGAWYGRLGDTLVGVGFAEGAKRPRIVYQSLTTRAGTVVREAEVREGRVYARLANEATIVLAPAGADEVALTWTSADGARVLEGRLRRVASPR